MAMKGAGAAAVADDLSSFTLSTQDVEFKTPSKQLIITSGTLKAYFALLANTTSATYEVDLPISSLSYGTEGAVYTSSLREYYTDTTQSAIISLNTLSKAGKPAAPLVELLDKGTLVTGTAAPNVGKVITNAIKVRVDLSGINGGSVLKSVYGSTTYQSGTATYVTVDQASIALTEEDLAAGFIVFTYNVPHALKDSNNATVIYLENSAGMDSDPSDKIMCSNALRVEFAVENPHVSASINSSSEITAKLAPNFYTEGAASVKVSWLIRPAGGLATAGWFTTDSMNIAAPTGTVLNQESAYAVKKISNPGGTEVVDIEPNQVYELVAVLCAGPDSLPAISANVPLYKLGVVSQSKNSNIAKGYKCGFILTANASAMNTDNLVLTKVEPTAKEGAGNLALNGLVYTPSTNPTGQYQMWELSSTKDGVKKLIKRAVTNFTTAPSALDLATVKALTVPVAEVAQGVTYELKVTDVLSLSNAALLMLPSLKTQEITTLHAGTYWAALDLSKILKFKDTIVASEVGKPIFSSLTVVRTSATLRNVLLSMTHSKMAEGLKLKILVIELSKSEAFDSQDSVFISSSAAGPAVKKLQLTVVAGDAPEVLSLYTFAASGDTAPVDLSNNTKYFVKVTYAAVQTGFSVTQTSDQSVIATLDPVITEDGFFPAVSALTGIASAANKTISGTFALPTAVAGYAYLGCKVRLFLDYIEHGSEQSVQTLGPLATSYLFSISNPQEQNYTITVTPIYRNNSTLAFKDGSTNYITATFPKKIKIVSSEIRRAPYGANDVVNGSGIDNKLLLKLNVTMAEDSANNVDSVLVTIPHSGGGSLTLTRVGTTAVWSVSFNAKEGITYDIFTPIVIAIATTASGGGWDYAPKPASA
jgi:hypothetical protein